MPLIHAHPLGEAVALHAPTSGAIVLSNEFGREIAKGVNDGLTAAQIAAELADPSERAEAEAAIHQVLQAWDDAGLLHRTPLPFPDPVDHRPVPHWRDLGGLAGTAALHLPDGILAEQIDTVMGHMPAQPGRPVRRLEAVADRDGYGIFRDGDAITGRIDLDAARFVLMREVAEITCGAADVSAVFHAGCVARNGRALILCGDSGNGKSTLTFGLVNAGCAYLGDDHVPLHRDGRRVMAFATAAGVKAGAWDLPEIKSLQARYGLTAQSPRVGVRYLPLHLADGPDTGADFPVSALVFPEFRPGQPFSLTRIAPEQALIQALKAGSRLSASHRSNLAPLADFLNHVPAYQLRYGASDQSVTACLDLLNQC
ncbi:hypothetical protein E7681_02990 [Thalassobius vesicularis]|uniref:PqqD family peptide modification chaperone n=1 Tax=Thalassobius vesicularis TaxID=1294297 RepID=A0A4S3MD66_9RHOB|nr:hypothetical protein [Thalassobius vesicularis]THD76819.1 hypothetical protein E7681_02990 [Thalassobius vesicularis]